MCFCVADPTTAAIILPLASAKVTMPVIVGIFNFSSGLFYAGLFVRSTSAFKNVNDDFDTSITSETQQGMTFYGQLGCLVGNIIVSVVVH